MKITATNLADATLEGFRKLIQYEQVMELTQNGKRVCDMHSDFFTGVNEHTKRITFSQFKKCDKKELRNKLRRHKVMIVESGLNDSTMEVEFYIVK